MTGFQDVVRTATVGTTSRPLDAQGLPEPVAAAGSAAPGAGDDDPSRTARLDNPELITAALDLVAARHLLLPPPVLDEVVYALPRDRDHDRAVVDIMDERSRAVYGLHDRWAGHMSPPEEPKARHWQDGDTAARVSYLCHLRATDPPAAHALLEDSDWLTTRAAEREALLEALEATLSAEDEPLLEARLDDRAQGVRAQAARLLAQLPDSALIARAQALAASHVSVRRGLKSPKVELTGVEMSPEVGRDGYPARAHRMSAALARVLEVVARVPTWRWPDLVGLTATELVGARATSDGQAVDLVPVLTRAAMTWRDAELAGALADRRTPVEPMSLLDVVDAPHRQKLLTHLLSTRDRLALTSPQIWPAELPRDLSKLMASTLVSLVKGGYTHGRDQMTRTLGTVLPARCALQDMEEVMSTLRHESGDLLYDPAIQRARQSLELRRDLLNTFQEAL